MRVGMVTYFDLGYSYGLSDRVFRPERRNGEAAIGLVGIRNPLGQGLTVDLLSHSKNVLPLWRELAARQIDRPEMELGWSPDWADLSREDFKQRLRALIAQHPVDVCEIVVHAVGTAFLRIEFATNLELRYIEGVLACFEFAGYRPEVSELLLTTAQEELEGSLSIRQEGFRELTSRPVNSVQKDQSGYAESNLFTAFTGLIRCIDANDEALMADVVRTMNLEDTVIEMPFEYHGRLLYEWSTCILVPRGEAGSNPDDELARLLECIHIAHVALGACEAFLKLAQAEIETQVEGFVSKRFTGRDTQELNRLRALALAVVNLTNFRRITQSAEDQRYFGKFQEDASLGETQSMLTEAVDVLYQVQEAEVQEHRTSREYLLNAILVLLASLTLVSVTADAYNFIRGEDLLFQPTSIRVRLLLEFILGLTLVVALLIFVLRPSRGRKRPRWRKRTRSCQM
jgi:hypothetical protein